MKQKLNFWLVIALVCGFAVSITSCKDDDKDENNEPSNGKTDEQVEQDLADAAMFWSVVGQLTDTPMPDDWKNATYEPAIGQPDGTNSAIRIVSCADEETAAARAADLLGADITTETADYTYQNDIVGTLTYRKTGGSSLATVDVSIKQMPGLSQIVYKTPEQMGQNASFSGTAYYRFGDVVSKVNADGKTDYWICVRPAFSPAGKGDTHWISVSRLPNANKKNPGSKVIEGVKLLLPTSLCTNKTHMQNLAELLYAMTHPTEWDENLRVNKGYQKLKYFGDFTYEKRYKFFNNDIFERVAEGWTNIGLFKEIFGLTQQELSQHLEQKGLSLVTGNATQSGNNITLPIFRFENTNLKTLKDFKTTSSWSSRAFNIDSLMKKGYIDDPLIVGATTDDRYWVCRYATGATLAQGAEAGGFDVHKKLPNCEDVFVYNRDVDHLDMNNLKNLGPYEGGYIGRPHYMPCDVYKDEKGNRWFVAMPSGIKCKNSRGHYTLDAEPYSYLFSFEGITYTSDKKRATNLPNHDEAIRASIILQQLGHNAGGKAPTIDQMRTMVSVYFKCVVDLYDNADIHVVAPWLMVMPESGEAKHGVWLSAFAYNDETDNDQKLIRFIDNPDNKDRQPMFYFWEHYPVKPSATGWYPEAFIDDMPIYLKDIADEGYVKVFAEDAYARSPVLNATGGDEKTPRTPRTQTDARAKDVTNYFYKKNVWENRTYPTDMWNEPVTFIRVTRVYDRGDGDYLKKTVDGHTLTLYRQCRLYKEWNTNGGDPDDEPWWNWERLFETFYAEALDDILLDGKTFRLPSWRDLQ
ncbi:MAG: hypothetical protein J6O54_00450 [Prevotella sp.]|nr:hypothetical protein [Prevotella sp.]